MSPVRLALPAERRYLRLVRLVAASSASDVDFDIDAIEDLRVVVNEVCAALIEAAAPTAELQLSFATDGDTVRIEGTCETNGTPLTMHPVASEVVSLLADDLDLDTEDGLARFALVKRRQTASA